MQRHTHTHTQTSNPPNAHKRVHFTHALSGIGFYSIHFMRARVCARVCAPAPRTTNDMVSGRTTAPVQLHQQLENMNIMCVNIYSRRQKHSHSHTHTRTQKHATLVNTYRNANTHICLRNIMCSQHCRKQKQRLYVFRTIYDCHCHTRRARCCDITKFYSRLFSN